MTVFIYGLKCPVLGAIRYIGRTSNTTARFRDHLYKNGSRNNHKDRWIAKLRTSGLMPEFVILQRILDDGDWQSAERAAIKSGLEQGWPLTNITAGGDGVVLLDPDVEKVRIERTKLAWASEELRAKHSKRLKVVFSSKAQKDRRSAASKAAWACETDKSRKSTAISLARSTDDARRKQADKTRAMHQNPDFKAKHSKAVSLSLNRPETQATKSLDMKRQWANTDKKSRRLRVARPETRQKMKLSALARWQDPAKRAAGVLANGSEQKRAKLTAVALERSTPEYRAMMAETTRLAWAKRRTRQGLNNIT